jgi:hypothetical protein
VDPFQEGVLEAVYTKCHAKHIVARIDVGACAPSGRPTDTAEVLKCIGMLTQTIIANIKRSGRETPFTGLLLANWRNSFSPMICTKYTSFLKGLGLDIYLEVSEPDFLTQTEVRRLDMTQYQGVVLKNGSILKSGDRRNCYQMANMQPVLRAVAAQACVRSISLMMWEGIQDDVVLDLAVARRSFTWYKYYSAISWIGPEAALMDAQIARARTLADEPLGSLMWLKNDAVMDAQEFWRFNDTVSLY